MTTNSRLLYHFSTSDFIDFFTIYLYCFNGGTPDELHKMQRNRMGQVPVLFLFRFRWIRCIWSRIRKYEQKMSGMQRQRNPCHVHRMSRKWESSRGNSGAFFHPCRLLLTILRFFLLKISIPDILFILRWCLLVLRSILRSRIHHLPYFRQFG